MVGFRLYWMEKLTSLDDREKRNHFLLYGRYVLVYDTYQPLKESGDEYAMVLTKLSGHFSPTANTQISVYNFRHTI
jgi:hypothetical protein